MLINKYLPAYDFNEFHCIKVNTPAIGIYDKMLLSDFSKARLIKFLFRLRGMSSDICQIDHLTKLGFIKLEEQKDNEIVYGYITSSPTFSCCQEIKSPSDFLSRDDSTIIKAVINFQVLCGQSSTSTISTETRVWCGSSQIRLKFRLYWFFINPFSRL